MALIRGQHSFDDHFTQIPNEWVRDKRLSLSAIGLLTQLMSHAPGWQITQESLARANGIGRDSMRTILNELMSAGYLIRSEKRRRNSLGHLAGYDYKTTEPTGLKPMLDNPTLGEPTQAEPTHKKNSLKEEQSKEQNAKESAQSFFKEFWNEYPRKLDKGKALKAFKSALTRASFEDILAGAIMYRDDPNRLADFTKYPATWLNADAWENGPLPHDKRAQQSQDQAEQERIKKEWGNL